MRFIGDVHGNMAHYEFIAEASPDGKSIQVGDFGAGFVPLPYHMDSTNHRFIRGNHDDPEVCRTHPNWIPDGHCEMINDMRAMFIGGALSIDKQFRTEGVSWWADEELSISRLYELCDLYETVKPAVMITHECPEMVSDYLCNGFKLNIPSRTRQAFQRMFTVHKPKYWIFGHWHSSFDRVMDDTRFICLDELQYIDL